MFSELPKLEEAIESKQFVAHANSILDTEMATEKVVTGRSYYVLYLHKFLLLDGKHGTKYS